MTVSQTHMTPALFREIEKKFENPIQTFVNYDIIEFKKVKVKDHDTGKEEMEDLGAVKDEFYGLVRVLSAAGELAYEMANECPDNEEKYIALGLLEKLCENVSSCFKPKQEEK